MQPISVESEKSKQERLNQIILDHIGILQNLVINYSEENDCSLKLVVTKNSALLSKNGEMVCDGIEQVSKELSK